MRHESITHLLGQIEIPIQTVFLANVPDGIAPYSFLIAEEIKGNFSRKCIKMLIADEIFINKNNAWFYINPNTMLSILNGKLTVDELMGYNK
jgi:hypothetical protein